MRKSSAIIFSCFILSCLSLEGQDVSSFKRIVSELSSPRFHGRGYTCDGVRKTGNYLERQYRICGADEVFQQPFRVDINTFPGKASMSVDGRKMLPGKDFLMREYSPGVHGSFPLYHVDTLSYDFSRIAADLSKPENKGCLVVCDFWFTYKHRDDFKALERSIGYSNAGMIYTWSAPLKFYKAYGEKVREKPIIWCGPGFPSDARRVSIDVDNEFKSGYECSNVIARVRGERQDSAIVFLAHYDHLGHFGKDLYFPGTDDNASGTAALVTLAAYYAAHKPKFDIWFLSVACEEANLRGSGYYVEHPCFPLDRIKFLINLDMIGDDNPVQYCEVSDSGMDGFHLFEKINSRLLLFYSLDRGKLAANSDHYPFAQKGVPCIFFENEKGSVFPYYHTTEDNMSRFVSSTYEKIFKLVTEFVELL